MTQIADALPLVASCGTRTLGRPASAAEEVIDEHQCERRVSCDPANSVHAFTGGPAAVKFGPLRGQQLPQLRGGDVSPGGVTYLAEAET